MVSQKDIKDLDFNTIEEYFDYIVESKINGNHSQVERLITALSKQQKKDFLRNLFNNVRVGADGKYCYNLTLKLL